MPERITLAQLAQTLDRINKDTTWAGLNAKQLQELATMDHSDWDYAARSFRRRQKDYEYVPAWVLFAGAIVSVTLAIVLFGAWRWVFGLGGALFVGWLCYRDGEHRGFFNGYPVGYRDTLLRLLRVPENDAREMPQRAVQMELDGRLAEALKKHTNQP